MKYDINHEFVSITSHTATHRLILIHGWGADADDLIPLGREILENTKIDFEVISLRAPELHPNSIGRQWYGLYPHDWNRAEDEVKKLSLTLKKFNTNQIPLNKTILLGFSQGAAMAIDAGGKLDFGLIISCSGYPHPNWRPERDYPSILISHGVFDDVVPISASRNILKKVKAISANNYELVEFDGYHQIDSNLVELVNLKIRDIF